MFHDFKPRQIMNKRLTGAPDLILIHGSVWTGNHSQPWAEAVAIRGTRILDVGSSEELKRASGPKTKMIELDGGFVLPGFIDSHTHFLDGGLALSNVQLRDVRNRNELASKIAAKVKEAGKGEWIRGGGWDNERFSPGEFPRKEWIDAVAPDNPVCLKRCDLHSILANSAALKIAEISVSTPAPPGGEIVKDPRTGEPTGILKDAAADLVLRLVPEYSFEEKVRAAKAALRHAAAHGLTSIHDMADAESFKIYQALVEKGDLTARLTVYFPISEIGLFVQLKKLKTHSADDFLKRGGLKGFVDGSLGTGTALFFEPYSDKPDAFGLFASQMFPEGIMEKRIQEADAAGIQVAVHAIGDKANHWLLDIYEKTMRRSGSRDRRWRIEHAQHLRPDDIGRFGALGVIASVQPFHAADDGRWAERKIGPDRAKSSFAFRSLLESGAILAFGSDWPVVPLDPLPGIAAAVTRATTDGKRPSGWIPAEKIPLEEAIKAYTLGGAYAEFGEKEKGSLESGKLADLVVLDKNFFKIPAEEVPLANVLLTVRSGAVVYRDRNLKTPELS